MLRRAFLSLILCTTLACAGKAPPGLSPAGVRVWQANEAVVALGTAQHAAIELNKVQVCNPTCYPLLSDHNTGVVVDNVLTALHTIKAVPDGWKATALEAINAIMLRIDSEGQARIVAYLEAARAVINAIGGQ